MFTPYSNILNLEKSYKTIFLNLLAAGAIISGSITVFPCSGLASEASSSTLEKILARLDRLEAQNDRLAAENAALKKEVVAHRSNRLPIAGGKKNTESSSIGHDNSFVSAKTSSHIMSKVTEIKNAESPFNQYGRFSGIYVGINAGYGRNNISQFNTFYGTVDQNGYISSADTFFVQGPFAGGQVGYNYQFANNFIIGGEADLDWSDVINEDYSPYWQNAFLSRSLSSANSKTRVGLDWIGTARIRLGWAFGPFLPYITAGFAYGQLTSEKQSFFYTSNPFNPGDQTYSIEGVSSSNRVLQTGWAAGAGAEYVLFGPWSVKGEYLYTSLGGISRTDVPFRLNTGVPLVPLETPSQKSIGTFGVHQFRIGLNYHINLEPDSSVAAKY